VLLALWIGGTLLFTGAFNWTVNARSVLPLAPAAGILLLRRLEARGEAPWRRLGAVVAGGAVLALVVAAAEPGVAGTARTAALAIRDRVTAEAGATWFEGHWGFQYYMARAGARPLDVRSSRLTPGDRIVVPLNNTNVYPVPREIASDESAIELPL